MKYTITKDAEAEIQYEGKEGIAGEKPRTVVEVRPSIRPFAVASRRANANATTTMKGGLSQLTMIGRSVARDAPANALSMLR